jgi:predicted protein tyrosine phosphatase
MKITVLNKNNFNNLMKSHNITCDNVESFDNLYLISINDTEGEMSVSYFENCDAKNVLTLYFDDEIESETGTPQLKIMNEDQGKEIINFLSTINVKSNTSLIIHCTAGQNRSGSVGKFAADFFNYGQDKLLRENPFIKGNSVVTRILNKLWLWGHYN